MAKSKRVARKAKRPARRAAARRATAPRRPRPIPAGFHSVTPSLVVRGAAKAMDFWKEAFGAKERMRMPAPFGGDAIWHGELTVGNSIIFCNDEMPGPGWAKAHAAGSPPTSTLWVYVDGADALFDRAVKAGCKVLSPMTDMFWGDRTGVLADPFGVVWTLAQHVKDVSEEDAAKAGEEFARSMQQQGGPPA